MYLWSVPDWIRDHLSFIRVESRERSLGDMSGLIEKGCCSDRLLRKDAGHVGRSNESNQNGPWSTLLHLAGVFEFPQTEVVPDGLGLNRAVCVNTGDDSHYVL